MNTQENPSKPTLEPSKPADAEDGGRIQRCSKVQKRSVDRIAGYIERSAERIAERDFNPFAWLQDSASLAVQLTTDWWDVVAIVMEGLLTPLTGIPSPPAAPPPGAGRPTPTPR